MLVSVQKKEVLNRWFRLFSKRSRCRCLPKQSGPYRIELLKLRDLVQIVRLEAVSFPEPLNLWSLLRLWLMPITTYLIVKKGRQVVAYIGFQKYGPAAHTISMCIHPDYRRQGLGILVQKTADEIAVNLGARWFTGEVRVSNLAQLIMLEGLGWQNIGTCRRFFGNGEDAVVVWNWLDPKQDPLM